MKNLKLWTFIGLFAIYLWFISLLSAIIISKIESFFNIQVGNFIFNVTIWIIGIGIVYLVSFVFEEEKKE